MNDDSGLSSLGFHSCVDRVRSGNCPGLNNVYLIMHTLWKKDGLVISSLRAKCTSLGVSPNTSRMS
jgi:hypothetical protein